MFGALGFFCGLGLGLGFVFNEMGKKIRSRSADNPFLPEQTGTEREGSVTEFVFSRDTCEAAVSTNWISPSRSDLPGC